MISTQILIYTIFYMLCDSNVVIRKALHSLTGARVISTFNARIETAAIVFKQITVESISFSCKRSTGLWTFYCVIYMLLHFWLVKLFM